MERLPNELLTQILEQCTFADCIFFRATSRRNCLHGNYVLGKTQTLDFRHYCEHRHVGIRNPDVENEKKNDIKFNPTKMINFMEFMPCVRKLVLVDLPSIFTLSDMIKLGNSMENLEKCVIIQNENQKWLGKDALIGLTFFKSLQKLKLIGWEPRYVAKRGCASRYENIPPKTLQNLVNFTIICKKEAVPNVLQYVLDNRILMKKCVKAKFNVRLSSADIPHLIFQFIKYHPHIHEIAFNGFLFTTQEQVQTFYNHLLALSQLERVRMENCSVIERIEQDLQQKFRDALRKRGIQFTNLVKSLSYG